MARKNTTSRDGDDPARGTRPSRDAAPAARQSIAAPGRQPWTAYLLLSILLASGLFAWARHRYEFDDAFISYRYAHNLSSGHGLVFNPGERVEGYSNLLWIVILTVGARVGLPPPFLAPALGVVSYLVILLVSWYVMWNGIRHWRLSQRICGTVLLFALVLTHGLASAAGSGLETTFFAALVLLALVTWAMMDRRPSLLRPVTAALLSLLILTRPDGIIPAGCILALDCLRATLRGRGVLAGCRTTFAVAWLPGATLLLHGAWRLLYYRSWFPNTYFAKGADSPHYAAGLAYLWAFVASYPVLVLLLAAAVYSVLRSREFTPGTWYVVSASAVSLLYSVYLVRVGGDFMDFRLGWHFLPALVLAGIIGFVDIAPVGLASGCAMAVIILGLCLAPVRLEMEYYMQSLDEMRRYVDDGTAVGRALRELPRDTTIATTLIGTVGYYSGLRIVDQWGLVDPDVRSRPARDRFVRGHVKFTPAVEALKTGADLYFEHPDLCPCDRGSLRTDHEVAMRLEDGGCVRALVISARDTFREAICADRAKFPVIGGEVCGS